MPDTIAAPDDDLEYLASKGFQPAKELIARKRTAAVRGQLYRQQLQARREGRRFHPAEAELAVQRGEAATPSPMLDFAETAGDQQAAAEEGASRGVFGGIGSNAVRSDLNLIRTFPGLATTEDITAHDVQAHAAKRVGMEEIAAANQGAAAKVGNELMELGKIATFANPVTAAGTLGLDIGIPTAIQVAETAKPDDSVAGLAAEAAAVAAGRSGAMLGGLSLGARAMKAVAPMRAATRVGGREVGTLAQAGQRALYGAAEAIPQVGAMTALGAPVEALAPEGVGTPFADTVAGLPATVGEFGLVNAAMGGYAGLRALGNARAIRAKAGKRVSSTPTDARDAYRTMQAEYPKAPGLRREDAPAALDLARARAEINRRDALDEVPMPEAPVARPSPEPLPPDFAGRLDVGDAEAAIEGASREGYGDLGPGEPVSEPGMPVPSETAPLRARRRQPSPKKIVDAEERARVEVENAVAAEGEAARESRIASEESAVVEQDAAEEQRIAELRKRAFSRPVPTPRLARTPVDTAEVKQVINDRVRERFAANRMDSRDPDVRGFTVLGEKDMLRVQELALRGDENAKAYVKLVRQFAEEHGGSIEGLRKVRRMTPNPSVKEALKSGERARAVGVDEAAKLFADVSKIHDDTVAEYRRRAEELHQFEGQRAIDSAVEAERARRADAAAARAELEDLVRARRSRMTRRAKIEKARAAARTTSRERDTLESGSEPAVETPEPPPRPEVALREQASIPEPEPAPPAPEPAKTGEAAPVAEPARSGEAAPADDHIAKERLREEEAKKRTKVAVALSKGHDAARAEADADFERTKAEVRTSKERIALKDATKDDRKVAVAKAEEHVTVADRRVKLAEERLKAAQGAGDAEATATARNELATAKADHAEAVADHAEISTKTSEARAKLAEAKRDEGLAKKNAEKAAQVEEATRALPAVEKGVRESLGKDTHLEVTEDGNLVAKQGEVELFPIPLHRKPRDPATVSTHAWWESAKGSSEVAKRIRSKLNGEMPKTASEVEAKLPPDVVRQLKKDFPVHASYNLRDRSVSIYGTEKLGSDSKHMNLVAAGREDSNHWLVHGMMGAALRKPEIRARIDTLVKVTGVDPRTNPERTVEFLEAVYKKYASWVQGAGARATGEALGKVKNANNIVERAFAAIGKFFRQMVSFVRRKPAEVEGISFDQVFAEMREGKFTLDAKGEAPKVSDEAHAVGRRPLEEGEEDSNLSLGDYGPKERDIVQKMRAKFAKPAREVDWKEQERIAEEAIAKHGSEKAAADDVIRRMNEAAERGDVLAENHLDAIIIRKALQKEIEKYTEGGVFHEKRIEDLALADLSLGEEAGRALQSRRDRLDSPEQRLAAVYKTFYTPSPEMKAAMQKAKKQLGKAKMSGDARAQAKAAEVFDKLLERHRASVERRRQQMAEVGVDLTDAKSLKEWLNDEAYGTVMSNIDNLSALFTPKSVPDWVVDNYRAHLLGNPLVTQTQQLASNTFAALSNTVRHGLPVLGNPNALRAALTRDTARAVLQNFKESYSQGKNAWVRKITEMDLGRQEDEKHLPATDRYSKLNHALSFNIMAAIDGAAQRYNAAIEGAHLIYREALRNGATREQAVEIAKRENANLSGPMAVEAMFRSLPHTFQELSLRREGEEAHGLDKLVGNVSRTLREYADVIPAFGLKDPTTGELAKIPISKIVLPFVRTTIAIARAASRHSLIGTGEASVQAIKAYRETIPEAKDLAVDELKKRVYESIVVGGVAMHVLAALLDAEGTEIDDKQAAYTGRAKGEKTLNILGHRIGYSRLEPFATPLAMAANGLHALREGKNPIPAELGALVHMGADLAWFRLIGDIGGAINDVNKSEETGMSKAMSGLGSWAQKTGVAMIPGVGHAGVRAVLKNEGDEITRPAKDTWTAWSEVGGGERVPVRDVWGRQVKRGPLEGAGVPGVEKAIGGAFGRSPLYQPTDVDQWAEKAGIKILGFAPEYPKGHPKAGTKMSDRDVAVFTEIAGPRYLERMRAFSESNPPPAADADKDTKEAFTKRAGEAMKRIKGIIDHRAMQEWKARQSKE